MEFTEKTLTDEFTLTDEEIQGIADKLERKLDYEATINLMSELAQATPIGKEADAELTTLDRTALLVRKAYKFGYLGTLVTHNNALKEAIHDLFNPNDENKLDFEERMF